MMAARKAATSTSIEVTVSEQTKLLLEQLAGHGIYGRSTAEVAGRFVDAALEKFVEAPRLRLPGVKKAGVR